MEQQRNCLNSLQAKRLQQVIKDISAVVALAVPIAAKDDGDSEVGASTTEEFYIPVSDPSAIQQTQALAEEMSTCYQVSTPIEGARLVGTCESVSPIKEVK